MAVTFRAVHSPPLAGLDVEAPDGALIGVVGEDGAGKGTLLRIAAGLDTLVAGESRADSPVRLLGMADELDLSPVRTLLLDHALARRDAVTRARAAAALERLRREGATILLVSHDEAFIEQCADEVWWLDHGRLAGRGEPREVLDSWRRHVTGILRASAGGEPALAPALRRGDGRAHIEKIDMLGEDGRPTMVWRSGEAVAVRVAVRFERPVDDPVVGIMIRTRVGFEVFGTNTELERLKLGPCGTGEVLRVGFRFHCHLCPQEYTLTAASHDPDGVWHDWLEDAVAFSVADTRYTAGVANLRAEAWVERLTSLPE